MTSPSSAESAPAVPKVEQDSAGPLQVLGERFRRGELGQLPVVLTLILIFIFFEVTSGGVFFSPQNLSNLILQIATIGFLGLGAQPPTPEWGAMLASALEFIERAPWVVTSPGLAILVTVLAFNLTGDGLRDALDPKLRRSMA